MQIFKIPFFSYDLLLFLSDGMTSFGFCILVFLYFDFFPKCAHEVIINNSKIWWKKIKQNYLLKMNNNFFK